MAAGQKKSIDEIDNIREMHQIMKALGISCKGLKTIEDMKNRVKSEFEQSPNITSWTVGQAFSVLSKIKDQDAKVKELLLRFYREVETCYDHLDDNIQTLLKTNMGNVKEKMKNHQIRMKQEDYYLLVAGETGSGKSSLINLILGEELLPYSVLSTTSTICELRYGEERRIVIHFKDKDPETLLPTKTFNLFEPVAGASEQSYLQQISPFVHLQSDREKGSIYKKVELYWPHQLLKKGIVIIDSPGVGESEIMDGIVTEYLPEAFALIYVINSPNAGGVQKDRLGMLLKGVKEKCKEEEFPSTCALFVCNKWDQIRPKEVTEVENYVIRQLKRFYPGIVPEKQIVQMSTKNASLAQDYGMISKEFVTLMNCMESMVLEGIKDRMEIYWRWLYGLISRIVYQTTAHVANATRDQEKFRKRITSVRSRLSSIEENQPTVMEGLRGHLESRVEGAVKNLSNHLRSDAVRSRFTSWNSDEVPKAEKSWEVTKSNITRVMESRLQDLIQHWEEDNHVFADTCESLVRYFKEKYNFVEGELRILQGAVISDEIMPEDHGEAGIELTMKEKVAIGVISPIWVPISLIILVVGAPMVGVMTIKSMLEDKIKIRKYDDDKCAFMKEASIEYLNDVTKEAVLMTFVKDQLRDAAICLNKIEARIPELIEADKLLCEQLLNEKRSSKDVKEIYQPMLDTASEIRGRMAVFGLEEGLSAVISKEMLDLKDQSDCLGRGAFASVYRGIMKTENGDKQTVAMKIWTESLKAENANDIVNEIEILKKLKHPNVVTFYGTSLLREAGETRVMLVMEYCTGNLKNHIFRPDRAPAKSKNADAKRDAYRWIKEITDALTYIHDQNVVHRDLKLDNILLSAANTVKISDVGVSKTVDQITGTLAGTPAYMAPEVFHSKVYDRKADIYSLGIILWEIWYGQQVFSEISNLVALFAKVDEGLRPAHLEGSTQPPRRWRELMESCWSKKPEERPSASHCLKEAIELHREAVEGIGD